VGNRATATPKFSKECLLVRHNNKLQPSSPEYSTTTTSYNHFPAEISVGCELVYGFANCNYNKRIKTIVATRIAVLGRKAPSFPKMWTAQRRTQEFGRLGLKPPLELDIFQKLYYLRRGD